MSLVNSIPVKDANGDQLTVYEFQDRRFIRKVRRLKLCTGEPAEYVDKDTFVLPGTGERLTRIRNSGGTAP